MTPYNTEIACKALNLTPLGVPCPVAKRCSLCGRPLQRGDLYIPEPLAGKPNFMDGPDLAASGQQAACGWCAPTLKKTVMAKLGGAVLSLEEGAFPILKDEDRAWFLLHPPKPPFVAVVASSKMQHLVWRTPVSTSTELFYVRFGPQVFTIRRPHLLRALEACKQLGTLYADHQMQQNETAATGKSKKKVKPVTSYAHPFLSLDRNVTSLNHGLLIPGVTNAARTNPKIFRLQQILLECTHGELWALATLAKKKTPVGNKPAPFTITLNTKENVQ